MNKFRKKFAGVFSVHRRICPIVIVRAVEGHPAAQRVYLSPRLALNKKDGCKAPSDDLVLDIRFRIRDANADKLLYELLAGHIFPFQFR
jgi:hypothetical protein